MLRKSALMTALCAAALCGTASGAERFLSLKIGPLWPDALLDASKSTAWDASIHSGIIADRKVAIGGGIDFLWNVYRRESSVEGSSNAYRLEEARRTFMFPVTLYLALDPLPDLLIHPCVSTQIGLNTMYYSTTRDSSDGDETVPTIDEDGVYMGFFWRIAADALYNIGESAALFLGIEYQISNPRKIKKERDDIFTRRKMSGFGLRGGIRLIY